MEEVAQYHPFSGMLETERCKHSKPAGRVCIPTPCARPNVSLLAAALRRGNAVAIQTGPQDAIPRERRP